MLKVLTKKLKNQSLSEIQPYQRKIPYSPSDEDDSDDSEGENQELAQIDKGIGRAAHTYTDVLGCDRLPRSDDAVCVFPSERRRSCILTPLATNQLQNQENQCCKVRALFPGLDRHSSEEELERISREFAAEKRKWSQVSRLSCHTDNTSSSDEEVKHLCGVAFRPGEQADSLRGTSSPVLFSASPPKRLQPPARNPAPRPLIFTSLGSGFEQAMPCKRHRQGCGDKIGRPSLDLEKMQQSIGGGRQPPHYVYDPAMFAFRSLSTVKPISPLVPIEEPSRAY
ncbi:hypothetical protein XENTR_v10013159 [Xenopus tropicalis]|nr:hypothetical protein XENTR_v10013159 [Xenopus tropicalis]